MMKKHEMLKQLKDKINTNLNLEVTNKGVEYIFNTLFEILETEMVKAGEVRVHGFGSFAIKSMPSRECVNPRTMEKMTTPAKNKVKFKASKALVELVN